jgi:phosphomannomutase
VTNTPQKPQDYHRFCPGEEQIKLSNAVCMGRRRSNFPKCKHCQFNDDLPVKPGMTITQSPPTSGPPADRAPADRIGELFQANDIRARCPDPLSEDSAWRIGQASAQFLRSELRGYDRAQPEKSTVIVGRDMRKSSPALAAALIEGLRAGGSPVIDVGMVDTPQLYFAVNRLTCCGGVQVTASHNPGDYNGFKICGQKGRPVSTDTGLTKIRKIAENTLRHIAGPLAPIEKTDLSEEYKTFVRGFLNEKIVTRTAENPLKLVVDASNGMAGRFFSLIFGDVEWLDIVRLNFEHNGEFIHEPNPLADANLSQLRDRVIRSKADFGVCFDGDADRMILIDGGGQTVRGDLVTALLAPYFLKEYPGSSILYDLRSSRAVAEEIRKAGGQPRRERSGHAYLKKALADAKAVFGGEYSGHYYFRDNWYCDSAFIAFAEVINVLNQTGQSLGELVTPLKRYCGSGEHSFRCDNPRPIIEKVARQYADAKIDYLDGITVQYDHWWFNVRPSITEPYIRLTVEADEAAILASRLQEVSAILGPRANPDTSEEA